MASQKTINVLLGEAIVAEMKAQKIVNPPALAMRCGLDGQIVRRMLNGSSVNPTFENLASLLHGLGKSWQWLGAAIKAGYDEKYGPRADRKRAAGLALAAELKLGKVNPKAKAKPPAKAKAPKPTKKVKIVAPAKARTGGSKPAKRVGAANSGAPATTPAPAPATAA